MNVWTPIREERNKEDYFKTIYSEAPITKTAFIFFQRKQVNSVTQL